MGSHLLEAFESQLVAAPDQVLLAYRERRLSRRQTDELANRLATALSAAGVGPGDRVGIGLQNSPWFPVAALATWKLDAVVVTVNPMYRERELAHLLSDSGCRVLLHDVAIAGVVGRLPPTLKPAVTLCAQPGDLGQPDGLGDSELAAAVAAVAAAPPRALTGDLDRPALLCYTSGTTAVSKGAVLSHRNLAFQAGLATPWMRLLPGDSLFSLAPMFHITGFVWQLVQCLAHGYRLVLNYRFEAGEALALFEREKPTHMVGSITAYIAMMERDEATAEAFSGFKYLFSGGAAVPAAVVEKFERRFGRYVHNAYGQTESTSASVVVPVGERAPIDADSGALSIGKAVPGVEVWVESDQGERLQAGEIGELCIRGGGVASGYWHRPEDTEATFRGGYLRSGDVARIDAEGWVYLVDRKRDMINASGFKIWPREVEDVLYEHEAVREAAVVGMPDGYRGETVHAHVSLLEGRELVDGELTAFCRERLASYKCPTEFVVHAELPKSATGKILRRVLREGMEAR